LETASSFGNRCLLSPILCENVKLVKQPPGD
jgi:hypothetical protein